MPKLSARKRPKRPDAAQNAMPRKVHVVHAGGSKAILGELDGRTTLGRVVRSDEARYQEHVGPDRTAPIDDLCRSAARHRAIANLAFAELVQHGVIDPTGNPRPAYEAFRKADGDLRAVVSMLGLKRKVREVTLGDVLGRRDIDGD